MDLNKENFKKILLLIAFTILIFLGLSRFSTTLDILGTIVSYIFPFILGACLAFFINIPLNAIERTLLKLFPKCKKSSTGTPMRLRPLSILLSLLFFIGVILSVILIVVPQISTTILSLRDAFPNFIQRCQEVSSLIAQQLPDLTEQFATLGFNWESLLNTVTSALQTFGGILIGSSISLATSIFSGMVNFFLGLVFAFYILANKETLSIQFNYLITAFLPKKNVSSIQYVLSLTNRIFTNFFTGQCTEAFILGCMFFVGMTILRFPYAMMISVLIGFTALIPILGSFIGCFIGAFLILVINPIQSLWFIVFFLVMQQIEGNLIYPKVVGTSVGLPPMWVLVAVSIGGSMMGVIGMLIFIPLTSVFYALLRDSVRLRLNHSTK